MFLVSGSPRYSACCGLGFRDRVLDASDPTISLGLSGGLETMLLSVKLKMKFNSTFLG